MSLSQHEIELVVRNIWEIAIGLEIEPTSATERPVGSRGFRTGFIQIAGAWEGVISCITSESLLLQAAAKMFSAPPESLTTEQLHDTLGELTNMIGGNLKALLPEPSYLCLPAVIEGTDYAVHVPTTDPMMEVAFQCGTQPFTVQVLASAVGAESFLVQRCAGKSG